MANSSWFDAQPQDWFRDWPDYWFDLAPAPMTTVMEIRITEDGTIWSDWMPYINGAAYMQRQAQIRVTMQPESQATQVKVYEMTVDVDVPTIAATLTALDVPAGGLLVIFADYGLTFFAPPSAFASTTMSGKVATVQLVNQTECFVTLWDPDVGVGIAGTLDLQLRGY